MKEKMGNFNMARNIKRKNNYMEVHKFEFHLEIIPTLMMELNSCQGLLSSGIEGKLTYEFPSV
jgi:hypothetical protein